MIVARHEVPGVTRKTAPSPYIWTEGLPRRGYRTQPRVSVRREKDAMIQWEEDIPPGKSGSNR
jgi:hypothetical protein